MRASTPPRSTPPARIFPMLPERLSTDLTSLDEDEDRLALVIEMVVGADDRSREPTSIAPLCGIAPSWPTTRSPPGSTGRRLPPAAQPCPAWTRQLRSQDARRAATARACATTRRAEPRDHQARPSSTATGRRPRSSKQQNRATPADRGTDDRRQRRVPRGSSAPDLPSLRRVVRSPKRWERIVEVARGLGETLPAEPDSPALEAFLVQAPARPTRCASPTCRSSSSS